MMLRGILQFFHGRKMRPTITCDDVIGVPKRYAVFSGELTLGDVTQPIPAAHFYYLFASEFCPRVRITSTVPGRKVRVSSLAFPVITVVLKRAKEHMGRIAALRVIAIGAVVTYEHLRRQFAMSQEPCEPVRVHIALDARQPEMAVTEVMPSSCRPQPTCIGTARSIDFRPESFNISRGMDILGAHSVLRDWVPRLGLFTAAPGHLSFPNYTKFPTVPGFFGKEAA